jgi:hypothetical protein
MDRMKVYWQSTPEKSRTWRAEEEEAKIEA